MNRICSSFQARSWPVTCLCPILCLDCCPEKSEPGASPPLGRQQGGKVSLQPHACPQWWCESVHIVPETLYFLTSTTGLGPLTPPNLNSLLHLPLRLRMVEKCKLGRRESISKFGNLERAGPLANRSMCQVQGLLLAPGSRGVLPSAVLSVDSPLAPSASLGTG